jgi:hypothetical protein
VRKSLGKNLGKKTWTYRARNARKNLQRGVLSALATVIVMILTREPAQNYHPRKKPDKKQLGQSS